MDDNVSIEIVYVVGHKSLGRWRHKTVRYFRLNRLTPEQHQIAVAKLTSALEPLANEFLDLGYDMTYKGKSVTKEDL
jgi:hypothetical protein